MKITGSYPKTRLRRLRKSKWIRNLVSETTISSNDLVLPIFVREGKNKIETIKTMPGVKRYTIDKLHTIFDVVQDFIVARTATFVSQRIVGDQAQYQMLQQQEAYSRALALEYETQQGQFTFFGHPQGQTNYYQSYQPFHALKR